MNTVEKKIFEVLYSCGAITQNSIYKCGGTDETIKKLIKEDLLKLNEEQIKDDLIAVYTMTLLGQKYCCIKLGKKHFYDCDDLKKCVRLSYMYMNLSHVDKPTWKNKNEWEAEYDKMTFPDATFSKGDVLYATSLLREEEKDSNIKGLAEFSKQFKVRKFKLLMLD